MNDKKVTKAKLYTFAEMRAAVLRTISEMVTDSSRDSDYDDPGMVAAMEMAVGSRILSELDIKHKRGEL